MNFNSVCDCFALRSVVRYNLAIFHSNVLNLDVIDRPIFFFFFSQNIVRITITRECNPLMTADL